jgi:hypothetical protein
MYYKTAGACIADNLVQVFLHSKPHLQRVVTVGNPPAG